MVELICGSAGSGKGTYIIEKIKENFSLGKKMFLLIPEQEAVIWEGRVCRELPAKTGGLLDVVNFKRLANEVARKEGGLSRVYAGKGKKLLLMWSALLSVRDNLNVYAADDGFEDKYAELMLETVGEMRKNRVTPAMLQAASAALSGGENDSLSKRLADLSEIYAAYCEICGEDGNGDPDELLDGLAETLRTSDFFKETIVFIDSFYSLTPAENEILYYIIRSADSVYVTFDFDRENRGVHFNHVRDFYKRAVMICERAGREHRTVDLKENYRTDRESLRFIEKNLWNFSAQPICAEDGGVSVIFCDDRYEESRAAGAFVEKCVHGGARYSEIAVIARDMEALRGIIDVHFDSLKIPYHLAERFELKTSPAVRLIMSFLACVRSGCRRENLIECLKTGLCPVSDRECASFEEYTDTWNLHGRKAFLDTEVWSMNPAGYTAKTDDWGKTVLKDANRVKGVLADEIKKIENIFKDGRAEIRDICASVCGLLEDFKVWESLCREADIMRAEGRSAFAQAEEKIYSLILQSLDTMVDTVGDVRVDAGRFSRLFYAVASSLNTGTIPPGVDMVTLGSAIGVRTENVKHVILLGCVEGEFPSAASGVSFFTEAEMASLETVGVTLCDTSEKLIGEELFRFWRAASMPSETLTLMVPRSDGKGTLYPSVGVKRIMKLLNLSGESFLSMSERDAVWSFSGASKLYPCLGSRAQSAVRALAEDFPNIKVYGSQKSRIDADKDSVSSETVSLLCRDSIYLTQTRIDNFSNCRFSYYMNYVMGLREQKTASVGAVDAGNFIHGILEKFFSETKDMEYPLPADKTEDLVEKITLDYISDSMGNAPVSSRQKYLFVRLRRNVLLFVNLIMKELAGSRFRPYGFELPIGKGAFSPRPLVFKTKDGTAASVYGVIDRVDTFTEDGCVYVKVVDYKTGKKIFKLSDIDRGVNLQLMIYLFTLWKDCRFFTGESAEGDVKIIPAGMVYFSAVPDGTKSSVPVLAGDGEQLAADSVDVSGMMLEDFCKEAGDGKKADKGGKGKKKNRVEPVSVSDFEALYKRIEGIVTDIAEDMKGGFCGSVPSGAEYNKPCRYCKLKPVCRHIERGEDC